MMSKPDVFVTGDIPSPLIGEGFRRKVYGHPDGKIVFKVAKPGEELHNITEWMNWHSLKDTDKGKWLAPCFGINPGGTILTQQRVDIVDTAPNEIPDWIKTQRDWEVGGNKTRHWGMFEGRYVMVDYGDQLFRYITEEDFMAQVDTLRESNPEHWGVEEGAPGRPQSKARWAYHKATIELLREIRPEDILEAGTMGIKVATDSDTIDIDVPEWNWRLTYEPTYNHDLNVMPWPVKDKQYDAFVALRVFHHMQNEEAFLKEMERISNHIILGLTSASAERYEAVKAPTKKIRLGDTDTTILYYKV